MLEALLCPACGHRYRTRFAVPPLEQTQAFDIVLVPPVRTRPPRVSSAMKTFVTAFASSFGLVALAGGLLWVGWGLEKPVFSQPGMTASAAAPQASRAERLYAAVGISMSLYDLDQAAGGTGRVIHGSDLHTLLLSYDYADQSVQVALDRTDVTSDDYRVRSVALYQGRTLLQRHAE